MRLLDITRLIDESAPATRDDGFSYPTRTLHRFAGATSGAAKRTCFSMNRYNAAFVSFARSSALIISAICLRSLPMKANL
jgi:hypothetical protein